MSRPLEHSRPEVEIRFLAFFGGRDNWGFSLTIAPGEKLIDLFGRLEQSLANEVEEKVFRPRHPRYAVTIDGKIIPPDQMRELRLLGGEKITVLARLVGG